MKKKLMCLITGVSAISFGCGGVDRSDEQSHVKAASELATSTSSVTTTEIYEGSEEGESCSLNIEKDNTNRIVKMVYRSIGCRDGNFSCRLEFSGVPGELNANFSRAPSVQFPSFTRIALFHGVGSPMTGALVAEDNFIVAKDDFTRVKAIRRQVLAFLLPVPIPTSNWASECLNVKKVQ
jgi:hypothetical protein